MHTFISPSVKVPIKISPQAQCNTHVKSLGVSPLAWAAPQGVCMCAGGICLDLVVSNSLSSIANLRVCKLQEGSYSEAHSVPGELKQPYLALLFVAPRDFSLNVQ